MALVAFIESPVEDSSAGYPSGGPFLVPPRKGERMRLKEALKGLLPQTKPPSLRILPARSSFREAGFRRFLRKHPSIQHIPCQCAHWRGIVDHFGFWKRLPVAIACYRFLAFSRNTPMRKPTQWVFQVAPVSKGPDRRIFRAGSALAQTSSLLRPGRFSRGAALPTAPP